MLSMTGSAAKRKIERDTRCKIILMPEHTQAAVWAAGRRACTAGVERLEALTPSDVRASHEQVPWRRDIDTETLEDQAFSPGNAAPDNVCAEGNAGRGLRESYRPGGSHGASATIPSRSQVSRKPQERQGPQDKGRGSSNDIQP